MALLKVKNDIRKKQGKLDFAIMAMYEYYIASTKQNIAKGAKYQQQCIVLINQLQSAKMDSLQKDTFQNSITLYDRYKK